MNGQPQVTRRRLLGTAALTLTLAGCQRGVTPPPPVPGPAGNGTLYPADAVSAILTALARHPLVALTERHMLQEWHDLAAAVLTHEALPEQLNDIVVEFGNAAYQGLCDRFVVEGTPVPKADLELIWRQTGDPTWNAPVYEQFFRTIRSVNRRRSPARRIRVLLGQPPVTMSEVIAHSRDMAMIQQFAAPIDDHYAQVTEQQVLARGRRALLIAGKGHLLRGIATDSGRQMPNAATQLIQRSRVSPYVIDNLVLPPGSLPDADAVRAHQELSRRSPSVVAPLGGTWLGATGQQLAGGWLNELADRALNPASARYENQADAVLYLGPGDALTASQPDPAIYHWSSYPAQVRQASQLAVAGDQLANGLRWATSGPSWFSLL